MQIIERRGTLTGIAMKDGIALSRALKSNSPLPLAGVAAAVKAGDNEKGIGLDEKKERVGKFLRPGPAESLKDNGELARIVGHALHHAVDFGAKAAA
jgi:hypothetical protein